MFGKRNRSACYEIGRNLAFFRPHVGQSQVPPFLFVHNWDFVGLSAQLRGQAANPGPGWMPERPGLDFLTERDKHEEPTSTSLEVCNATGTSLERCRFLPRA